MRKCETMIRHVVPDSRGDSREFVILRACIANALSASSHTLQPLPLPEDFIDSIGDLAVASDAQSMDAVIRLLSLVGTRCCRSWLRNHSYFDDV